MTIDNAGYILWFSATKKPKQKEDETPTVQNGVYMFPNGDKYGMLGLVLRDNPHVTYITY